MIYCLYSAGNEIKHLKMLQMRGVGYNYTIYEKDLCVRIRKMESMPCPLGAILQSHEFVHQWHQTIVE